MKLLLILFAICFATTISAQQHSLQKLWETDSVVAVPESVYPVKGKDLLYVSLIDGGGWEADSKGGIAKLGTDGKNFNPQWITGLNAPKGIGVVGNKLYAADISEVAVIDIAKGKVDMKIKIDSAKGLNDITTTADGVVYVSDS